MDKKELRKKYDKLVADIEEMRIYDGRNRGVDVYYCDSCKEIKLTRYRDKGVTPFTEKCHLCGGLMVHTRTISEEEAMEICNKKGIEVKNWIRPSFDQLLKMDAATQDHVLNGGLVIEEEMLLYILNKTVKEAMKNERKCRILIGKPTQGTTSKIYNLLRYTPKIPRIKGGKK